MCTLILFLLWLDEEEIQITRSKALIRYLDVGHTRKRMRMVENELLNVAMMASEDLFAYAMGLTLCGPMRPCRPRMNGVPVSGLVS